MMKYYLLPILLLTLCGCKSQNSLTTSNEIRIEESSSKPKLIVGIVIDQMRYDYLTRFYDRYGEGGFKRLVEEGFNCKNNHFNYIPTKTGPGHASIFTGTTPKYHGIIGNDWFNKKLLKNVNCVEDNNVQSIGADTKDGRKSPQQMLTTTFADENRLHTQFRGKTIGVSLKHRGAILPAGHTANAAYWWDYEHDGSGKWMTSSFYMEELPAWVQSFNNSKHLMGYFTEWKTLYPIDTYTQSGPDLNTYERIYKGKKTATFPYNLAELKNQNEGFKIIAESPYGNNYTTDFAIAAIDGENLGKDSYTDVLTISYSSTDKVGHDFGPNSVEVEDTYLRLDKDLERLLNALDEMVGKDEYTVFLTSDHGAPHAISFLDDLNIPSGLFDLSKMRDELNDYIEAKYGISELILSRINNQLFLDHKKIEDSKLDLQILKKDIANKLLKFELIDTVLITSSINLLTDHSNGYTERLLANGHHQKRSGDIVFTFTSSVFKDTPWNRTGTDHHSGYTYDTHVPLLFYGSGIKKGSTLHHTEITDIAPTISALLGISFPNASIGNPLEFVLKEN